MLLMTLFHFERQWFFQVYYAVWCEASENLKSLPQFFARNIFLGLLALQQPYESGEED